MLAQSSLLASGITILSGCTTIYIVGFPKLLFGAIWLDGYGLSYDMVIFQAVRHFHNHFYLGSENLFAASYPRDKYSSSFKTKHLNFGQKHASMVLSSGVTVWSVNNQYWSLKTIRKCHTMFCVYLLFTFFSMFTDSSQRNITRLHLINYCDI